MKNIKDALANIDWPIFLSALCISMAGLATMYGSVGEPYFAKQAMWIGVSVLVFILASTIDYQFLRRTSVITTLYFSAVAILLMLLTFGAIVKGAQNQFSLGLFSIQPADPAKLILVALLAKYFARRHTDIAQFRHIFISGAYASVLFLCAFFQPDMGSGIIIFFIWFGMIMVAGISRKHLIALLVLGAVAFGGLWSFALHPYQKQRLQTFVNPLTDIRGSGYNVYQSIVAVGSGELLGKGVGYGTQSKLRFLPEYHTDFIFASYAEEWGFVGVVILFALFALIIARLLFLAGNGVDNFETLFVLGICIYIIAQFLVHTGMDIGLFPVTGTTMPFMSYGGSHLLTEYAALGAIMGMVRKNKQRSRAVRNTEFLGAF